MDYSFIIPAYNEGLYIGRTIKRMKSVKDGLSPEFTGEIIVVDNNSSDNTAEISSSAGVKVVSEKINCIARARNTGASNAKGKYLIFVDADTLISIELVKTVLEKLVSGKVCGGGAKPSFDKDSLPAIARFSVFIWDKLTYFIPLAAGSFIFCLRKAWSESGGFNEKYYVAEEILFSQSLKKWGKRNGQQFVIIDIPAETSTRKFEWYTNTNIMLTLLFFLFVPFAARNKRLCRLWYDSPKKRTRLFNEKCESSAQADQPVAEKINWFMKKYISILILISVCFTAGNIWIYKNKEHYRYTYENYLSLYYPKEIPSIIKIRKISKDEILLKLSTADYRQFKVYCDGKEISSSKDLLKIKLQKGRHRYKINAADGVGSSFDIMLVIQFVPAEVYSEAGNSDRDVYNLVYSNIPVGKPGKYSINDFIEKYPADELDEAGVLLKKEAALIFTTDDTHEKINHLGTFLLEKLEKHYGIPSAVMDKISPLKQYKAALNDESKIWCSNLADIYAFFANACGIPTRKVSTGGSFDLFHLSGHAFAESFIKEKNQWAFVDPSAKILFIQNADKDLLNTLDLFNLNLAGIKKSDLKFSHYQNGKILLSTYDIAERNKNYFTRDATYIFSRPNIKPFPRKYQYLLNPNLAYSLEASNLKHYIKYFLFYGEIILILCWIITGIVCFNLTALFRFKRYSGYFRK